MENRKVRLIDANVFIKDLTAMKSAYDAIALDGMVKALKEVPTIDPGDLWPHAKWAKDHTCTNCGEYALEAPEAHVVGDSYVFNANDNTILVNINALMQSDLLRV